MEKENGLYLVIIDWYDNYRNEDQSSCAFVIAKNIVEVAEKINKDFTYVNGLRITEVVSDCVNMVYVPNDPYFIERIKDENSF